MTDRDPPGLTPADRDPSGPAGDGDPPPVLADGDPTPGVAADGGSTATDASPRSSRAPFDPPVALASLSGSSDAAWARAGAAHAGAAFLGGIALDHETRAAARRMVARGREEFIPPDPLSFLDEQLSALSGVGIRPGFNVRAVDPAAVRRAAAVCVDHGAILEVNAHCRQDEMCAAGAGEALLKDGDRLCEQVRAAADAGAAGDSTSPTDPGSTAEPGPTVSVKVRTEIPGVDLPALAADLADAGADLIHVDAMDSEPVVREVVRATGGASTGGTATGDGAAVVANNGVRDRETVREYLAYGADAVSVGRPSDDPAVLRRVRRATEAWFRERERTRPGRSA